MLALVDEGPHEHGEELVGAVPAQHLVPGEAVRAGGLLAQGVARGVGYRRRLSPVASRRAAMARGEGGKGFSFVLSLTMGVPGLGCRPGT